MFSAVCAWEFPSSISSSLILVSSLARAARPPRTAASLASAALFSSSDSWLSRALLVLLSTELISKPGGVNHGLLGLLLGVLGLVEHVVNLCMESVHGTLNAALLTGGSCVNSGHLVGSIPGL